MSNTFKSALSKNLIHNSRYLWPVPRPNVIFPSFPQHPVQFRSPFIFQRRSFTVSQPQFDPAAKPPHSEPQTNKTPYNTSDHPGGRAAQASLDDKTTDRNIRYGKLLLGIGLWAFTLYYVDRSTTHFLQNQQIIRSSVDRPQDLATKL